jgi:ribonuclease HI
MSYVAYTDGASRKDGRGGWGAYIESGGSPFVRLFGGEEDTTNNRMELTAVLEALWYLPPFSTVHVVSDSRYVLDGAQDWVHGWEKRGWVTSEGSPIKNSDLWQELLSAIDRHERITWEWVRGHTGVYGNEEADRLAGKGVASLASACNL